jgi:hypothetical protein
MKISKLFTISFLLFISCYYNKNYEIKDIKIKGIRVSMKMSSIENNIYSNIFTDSTDIYNYDGFVLYKKSYIKTEMQEVDTTVGDTKVFKLINPSPAYYYLLKIDADTFCYKIDSLNQSLVNLKKISLDSSLKKNLSTNYNNIYKGTKLNYILSDSEYIDKKNTKYIYRTKEKKDVNYSDSIYLYYSLEKSLLDISFFSLSNEIDKTEKGKLFKVIIIYNKNSIGTTEYEKMNKRFVFELKEIKVENEKEIVEFINKYKKSKI